MNPERIKLLQRIIISGKPWVLFEHGTVVVIVDDGAKDLKKAAKAILDQHGPVECGSAGGDFTVINVDDAPGWVVTYDHPDVLTYIAPDEVDPDPEYAIGLLARGRRGLDSEEQNVVYVEER